MRRLLDNENVELRAVLDTLLTEDVDVTVREVARRHSKLRNASAFTRNADRMAMIEQAKQRQEDARHVKMDPELTRSATLSELLVQRNQEVKRLKAQVSSLVASHAACVRAVMLHGGMSALERFWTDYKSIGEAVRDLEALPSGAEVIELRRRRTNRKAASFKGSGSR
jgi:hypothetical protein